MPPSRPFHSALPRPTAAGHRHQPGDRGWQPKTPALAGVPGHTRSRRDGTAWSGPKQTSRRRDPKAAGGCAAEAPALRRRRRRGDRSRGGGGGQPAPHLFSFAPFRTSLVDLTQEYSAMSGYGKRGRTRAAPPRLPDGSPGATSFAGPRSVICWACAHGPPAGWVGAAPARALWAASPATRSERRSLISRRGLWTQNLRGKVKRDKFKATFKSMSPCTFPFWVWLCSSGCCSALQDCGPLARKNEEPTASSRHVVGTCSCVYLKAYLMDTEQSPSTCALCQGQQALPEWLSGGARRGPGTRPCWCSGESFEGSPWRQVGEAKLVSQASAPN